MCGIAAVFGREPLGEGPIATCLARMRQRGPDGHGSLAGSVAGGHWTLLHTRLAILDLDSRSNQPFIWGPIALVFNGEIYNYREIRAGLEAKGFSFKTTSDTEVLAILLATQGLGALDQCEGMWAFVAVQRETGEVMIGRDRFGEKPLYWEKSAEGGLLLASEPVFIEQLRGASCSINTEHCRRFLSVGFRALHQGPQTFLNEVEMFPCGTGMTVQPGGNTRIDWSWPRSIPEIIPRSRIALVDEFHQQFHRAVELRMRADVPLAFCLSGGLDSSAIVATAVRELGGTVHTFSIVDSDPRYDERGNIEAVIRHLGIPHTTIELSTDRFLPRLARLIRYHQKPIATISYYAHALLSEAIHTAGFKVSVSGTGADELLGGYYEHFLLHLRAAKQVGETAYHVAYDNWRQKVLPLVRNPFLRDPAAFLTGEPDFSHLLVGVDSFMKCLREPLPVCFHEAAWSKDPFSNRLLNELFHEIVPVILEEDDRNSMCYSVENRSPYLDSALFDFCFSVPRYELISDGYSKSLLREALNGMIPDQVRLDREKKGFNASLNTLIRFSDPETMEYLLADGPIYDIVDRNNIRSYFVDTPLPNSVSKFLFSFIGMKLFLDDRAGLLPQRFLDE